MAVNPAVVQAPVEHSRFVDAEPTWRASRYLVPVGRALFALIFLLSVPGHFTAAYAGYAAQQGVPLARVAVPLTGVMILVGGLSVLFGFRARFGAWLLVLFLVPVAIMMHNFWAVTDPVMRGMQQAHFFKNIAMTGGALLIAYFGAGPFSIDRLRLRWRVRAGAVT